MEELNKINNRVTIELFPMFRSEYLTSLESLKLQIQGNIKTHTEDILILISDK